MIKIKHFFPTICGIDMLESLGKRRISEGIIGLFGLGCFLKSDRKEMKRGRRVAEMWDFGKRWKEEDYRRLWPTQ